MLSISRTTQHPVPLSIPVHLVSSRVLTRCARFKLAENSTSKRIDRKAPQKETIHSKVHIGFPCCGSQNISRGLCVAAEVPATASALTSVAGHNRRTTRLQTFLGRCRDNSIQRMIFVEPDIACAHPASTNNPSRWNAGMRPQVADQKGNK